MLVNVYSRNISAYLNVTVIIFMQMLEYLDFHNIQMDSFHPVQDPYFHLLWMFY